MADVGDGVQQRALYSSDASLFRQVKRVFDPGHLLSPGRGGLHLAQLLAGHLPVQPG